MSISFADAFLQGMRFEHWLRFYFSEDMEGRENGAVLRVPSSFAESCEREHPELIQILNELQGNEIGMERSRDAVFSFIGDVTGIRQGSEEFERVMSGLAGDEEFRRNIDFFHSWVQELADNAIDLQANALPPHSLPDGEVPSFSRWEKAFSFWKGLQKPLDSVEVKA